MSPMADATERIVAGNEDVERGELATLLERNGFPAAAQEIAAGADAAEALAYLRDVPLGEPAHGDPDGPYFYDDGEGRWLHAFVRAVTTKGVKSSRDRAASRSAP